MIPRVQVPMDFGIQYLGSPAHSNLKFLLGSGEELLANSMIVSYNSPVVDRMTTHLFQNTIEVEEFSKDAVQCFLEASYSGNIKKISKLNFRDVNKMAYAFEVTWLIERCFGYFQSLTDEVTENDFDCQRYVFDEAMFILEKLKHRNYIDTVIKKFTTLTSCTQHFATHYLNDISKCSMDNLNVIIEMTGKQEYILVEVLCKNFEANKSSIDQNSRYILEKLNFAACQEAHRGLYERLFKNLEEVKNPTKDDYKLTMKIIQKFYRSSVVTEEVGSVSLAPLPNLFNHDFKHLKCIDNLDELTNFLTNSAQVKNSYIFYDAIYSWLFTKSNPDFSPFASITNEFVKVFAQHASKSGWKPLAPKYIKEKKWCWSGELSEMILQNPKLLVGNQNECHVIPATREYTPDDLFGRDHDIKFRFDSQLTKSCTKESDCGFILRVSAASGAQDESFNIQLLIDSTHYGDDVPAEDIHFAIDIRSILHYPDLNETIDVIDKACPVTWFGKPCRDRSKQYWCWGPHYFYDNSLEIPVVGHSKRAWHWGSMIKIRPVLYYFGE